MKKILSVFTAFVLTVICIIPCFAAESENSLAFSEDGTFKILHLTDTQDDQNPSADMLNLLKRSIAEVQPDLIVFTGDLVEDSRIGDMFVDDAPLQEGVCVYDINGNIKQAETYANVKTAADAVLSVLEASGIPFAVAQGNNDCKVGLTNEDWLQIYSQYSNCLVTDESNDENGRLDYNLLINGKDGTPLFNIWIMDTGRGGVEQAQIDWYKTHSGEITEENGSVVPAFVFQHIYVDDIGNLFEKCNSWDEDAGAIGIDFYRLNRDIANGENYFVYEPGKTTAEFTAWKDCGDVVGAFFGHQHVEGFSGVWNGIELGFTYGAEFAKLGPYGFRVITLHEDDVLNYDNEVYTYSGSVKLGTDKISKQEERDYIDDNSFVSILLKIKNFMLTLVTVIKGLFA